MIPARPPAPSLAFECSSPSAVKAPQLGLVLTGGGAFGAWEAGALEALFQHWNDRFGCDPPIRVAVGTSTGALIAPFSVLGFDSVRYVAQAYQSVGKDDIFQFTVKNILRWKGVYDWGYPEEPCGEGRYLYRRFAEILRGAPRGDPLEALAAAWASPDRRIVAASTVDLGSGTTDFVMNWPADLPPSGSPDDRYCSRFYHGVFASEVPPLLGPPIPLENASAPGSGETPHFDGGPYQEAPFDLFFQIQSQFKVSLTHVVLISSYPLYPGSDTNPAQKLAFPQDPSLFQFGARYESVVSEWAVTSLTYLACQALTLSASGERESEILRRTGMHAPFGALQLVAAFPCERMGFDPDGFDEQEMTEMRRRGQKQAAGVFQKYFP